MTAGIPAGGGPKRAGPARKAPARPGVPGGSPPGAAPPGAGPPGAGPPGAGPAGAAGGARRRASRLVDIAQAAGVHVSTVSRVLNGDPAQSIRPETYERILAAARQQGYRPNAMARALKISRTGAFTFVIPLLRNPIWARLQHGALRRAAERGYVVMIMEEPTEDPRPPDTYRYLIEESRADGLLLATALRVPEHAAGVAVPHVYVNRRGPDRGNNVVMDEAAAVEMFIAHVAGLGHRTVTIIDGPPEVDTVHRRTRAARRACAAHGVSLVVRNAPPTEEGGWDATIRMLRRGPVPTACGVGSLNQLFGVMGALRAAQISVPAQMSLVSFDEDECLAFLEVPVTSISMPLGALGSAAVDALITRVEGGPAGDVMITEPMELVSRASVAPPPPAPAGS